MKKKTLHLDDDVALLLRQTLEQRGGSVDGLVNEALRLGLRSMFPASDRGRYSTPSVHLGGCLLGDDLDNIQEVLAREDSEKLR